MRESRARIVKAADAERRRMERDLHDGAQQHLVLMQLKLGMAERLLDKDPAAAKAMHAEVRADLERALRELRDLAHGMYPAVLESDGLKGALEAAAERAAIPTSVDCDGAGRYPAEVETAVYFCCLEGLQNAAKHAGDGATAAVMVTEGEGELRFSVRDDGAGFDGEPSGHGIQNMRDRLGALGGRLHVSSASGSGTTIAGTIPVERADAV
jgi:signal transduction histidine kinase